MADIRGNLIFDRFEPQPSAPHYHDGHDLALLPDGALEAAPASAPTLNSEPTTPIEDGRLDATSGAAIPTAVEPNTSPALLGKRLAAARVLDLSVARGGALLIRRYS